MLVLSRKIDETIIIGDNIKIQVIKIKGNTIRLGIEAPSDVKILRGELAPYGVGSKQDSDSKEAPQSEASQVRFANSATNNNATVIEFDVNLDDLNALPNPFVTQAS